MSSTSSQSTKPINPVKDKYAEDTLRKLGSDRIAGKSVAITGSTSGIGLELAKIAAENGASRIFLLNRSSARATAAEETVKASGSSSTVTTIPCDLQSFASVREAAAALKAATSEGGLDVLILNAGIMAMGEKATVDGYDVQAQTNVLSHFLLTKDVFPSLERAAEIKGEARVVSQSSGARNTPKGPVEAKYFEKYQGPGTLGGDSSSMFGALFGRSSGSWLRYHQTKCANCVFTFALNDRLQAKGSKVGRSPCP